MKVPFLDLDAHHAPLMPKFQNAIQDVIDKGAFAGGPFVSKFEEEFASYCECQYSVGVGSGTEALWLVLLALEIGHGDEVITVPNSFMATAEAITFCGAYPVFVDVDEATYTMDPEKLYDALSPRTRAIIPVHLFGQSADMDPILKFAQANGLYVIEDACQAHGARYNRRRVGSAGVAGCFSFYPGKNLGAFGEAGAVTTNDPELLQKIRVLRDHGQVRKYHHSMVGWNCRMDGIQAAVLSLKLQHLEEANCRRRALAAHYQHALCDIQNITLQFEAKYAHHVYHLYVVRVKNRDAILRTLAEKGISCGIHYPVPIHLQDAYRALNYERGSFPIAETCAEEFLSLPMFPELTEQQVDWVADCLKEAVVMHS